jgi:hypothetical protein
MTLERTGRSMKNFEIMPGPQFNDSKFESYQSTKVSTSPRARGEVK